MPSYHNYLREAQDGNIDLINDDIRVALLTSSYTPDLDHAFFDEVSANEVSGTGYTAGGAALTGKVIADDDAGDRAYFDADDVVWANSTITARYAVIYKNTGVQATSPLIDYIDFGSDRESSGADFRIEWNALGIHQTANA